MSCRPSGVGRCLSLPPPIDTAHCLLGRKVDLVGMDACLMTMIEFACQLRDHARVLVGSEELEAGAGRSRAEILGDLATRPAMAPAELGATVVRRYVASYRHGAENPTQSGIDLGQLDDLVEEVALLARRLLAGLKSPKLRNALRAARRQALRFFDGLYVDLHRLGSNLAQAVRSGRIAEACRDIQRVAYGQGARSPLLAEGHVGTRMAPAWGLSTSCPPFNQRSVFYGALDFTKRTSWADFLAACPVEDGAESLGRGTRVILRAQA